MASPHSTDVVLVSLGFSQGDDGVLVAPKDSRVTLTPIGTFFELRVSLGDGNAIVAVLSKSAIKITREGAPSEAVVDVDSLISGTPRKDRPW